MIHESINIRTRANRGRVDWYKYFFKIVDALALRSSCLRRKVGAVIVKDNIIISHGYNGAPSGIIECTFLGRCARELVTSGNKLQSCRGVHAEVNAIINAATIGRSTKGATLYCTNKPCVLCANIIANCGIVEVCYKEKYSVQDEQWINYIFNEKNIKVWSFDELKNRPKIYKCVCGKEYKDYRSYIVHQQWCKQLCEILQKDPRSPNFIKGGDFSFLYRKKDKKERKIISNSVCKAYIEGRAKYHSWGKKGFRKDLGQYFRSTWEANFARILKYENKSFKYECKKFELLIKNRKKNYIPDFWVDNDNCWYEIKGWINDEWFNIEKAFKEQYYNEKLVLIGPQQYCKLLQKYINIIKELEG